MARLNGRLEPNAGCKRLLAQHLAGLGAPTIIRNPAFAIDGPGMLRGSRVQPRGSVRIADLLMRWYFRDALLERRERVIGDLWQLEVMG